MTTHRPAGALPPETLAAIRVVFFEECVEHMAAIRAGLGALEAGDADLETLERIHRAVHSIKGAAGIFDLDALAGFAGRFEPVLTELRDGRLKPEAEVLSVLSDAAETLGALIEAGRDGGSVEPDRTAPVLASLAALTPALDERDPFESLDFAPRAMDFRPLGSVRKLHPRGPGKA